MKKKTWTGLALVTAGALTVGVLAGVTGVEADTQPPWQSASTKSPHAVGSITLVDASGATVTSGDLEDPLAAWALGSGGLREGDTVASLAVHTPSGEDEPAAADDWSGIPVAAPTTQTSLPTFARSGPSVDLAGSIPLSEYLGGFSNDLAQSGYDGVYELRLSTGAPGKAFSEDYDVLDIQVSGDQWHLYGEGTTQGVATTTSVAVTPAGGRVGQALTLTATVTQGVAGSVQFTVGSLNSGSPVEVTTSTGKASISYTPTSTGAITVGATFTPTDSAAYQGSSATPVSYTVAPAGPSAACASATTAASNAVAALSTATVALAKAKTALSQATTATVKAYVKASAKVTAATAASKAARTKAAKKKAKKALASAKKALTKAKKKAGSALTTYNRAVTAEKAAAATQSAKAAAATKAAAAKTAACA